MSTAVVSPVLPVVQDNETYALLKGTAKAKDDKGNETDVEVFKVVSEGELEKWTEAGYTVVNKQTFIINKAQSMEGIHELCPNEVELVNIFNSGAKVKQQNKARQLLSSTGEDGQPDFEFQEGGHDLREYIPEERQRRGLSETEKAMRFLAKLSPEAQAQVAAALASGK